MLRGHDRFDPRSCLAVDAQSLVATYRPQWLLWKSLSKKDVKAHSIACRALKAVHDDADDAFQVYLGLIFATSPYNNHLDCGIFDLTPNLAPLHRTLPAP